MRKHELGNDKQVRPGEIMAMAALLGIITVVMIFLVLLLAPGMVFNIMLSRFAGSADGLIIESIKDVETWLISAVFWFIAVVWVSRRLRRYEDNTRDL